MKELYTKPESKIDEFSVADVITTSIIEELNGEGD